MENTKQTMTAVVPSRLNLERPAFSLLVKPVVSNQEILTAWQAYQDLKLKLLTKDDFAIIQGQEFAKKSAYRKLALAFGVSVEITDEKRIELSGNNFGYDVTAKATSPNGRFMFSMASAHSNEKKFSKPSDVRAIAQTRATNRAISDLLGGVLGVSADEMVINAEPVAYEPFSREEEKDEEKEDEDMDNQYFDNLFKERNEDNLEFQSATGKQLALIEKLAESKCSSERERSEYLNDLDNLSKSVASERIGRLLKMAR